MVKTSNILRILYHLAGWILLYILPPLALQSDISLPSNFGDFMYWFIVIICFYINYLWLIPRFLTRRNFAVYFLSIFLMLVFTYTANEVYGKYVRQKEMMRYRSERLMHNEQDIRKGQNTRNQQISNNEQSKRIEQNTRNEQSIRNDQKWRRPRFRGYNSALFCFAILALGTSIKVTENWYENEKQKKVMENQKLGAELSLLKSQINPHFFFNTLNSIYSLAIIKSDKTPEAIIKLSEIMRYIIYDTELKLVPLLKEVEYIGNYIELQSLRLTKEVKVSFLTNLSPQEVVIEPLLLLPFIENAFKHGVDVDEGGEIIISVDQSGNELHLHVENTVFDDPSISKNGSSGIGMNNTIKRLKLLYQDNYTLKAERLKSRYVVDLMIKLKEHEMPDS